MILTIKEGELDLAKKMSKQFDTDKSYNKFKCSTNYIGALGEIVLNRYLKEKEYKYIWVGYNKQKTNNPDFIIKGYTVDIKTTYSDVMWFQTPIHDIYIYAQLTPNNEYILFFGFNTKLGLEEHIKSGTAKKITRVNGNRYDYIIKPEHLFRMYWLL